MAYRVDDRGVYIEVRLSGETSKFEILEIIGKLAQLDPGKQRPDLWIVSRESQVPFHHFGEITASIKCAMPKAFARNRSAIVASDELHKAQLEMYRDEASILPYEFRVFVSHDEALAWILQPDEEGRPC